MNTEIHYLYRDKDNYKAWTSVILSGALDQTQVDAIVAVLEDGVYFLPIQVGLFPLQSKLQTVDSKREGYDPYGEDGPDHFWHELRPESIVATKDQPTKNSMSASKFYKKFMEIGGDWDVAAEQDAVTSSASFD